MALSAPLAVSAATGIPEMAAKVLPYQEKPRVFVLTDIGNEPDDQMSLTRFLLYSNEMNVEGLVATTSTPAAGKSAYRHDRSGCRSLR